ncbi:Aste57867_1152 [Aphanomyces stellatus]|uniref:Aste57867_1152 protein n=1 Tax=Aphanomyces stellatus TaxID=120398 RepID=A0A485K762_9STRA|nr:hypothetical protein As57867_001151 [Aphanomyces stellatus]VFT78372.1 Aste57867_1152 [Aphanomyces stellatus]
MGRDGGKLPRLVARVVSSPPTRDDECMRSQPSKQTPSKATARRGEPHHPYGPPTMRRASGHPRRKKRPAAATFVQPMQLTALDQRILVLYNSKLRRAVLSDASSSSSSPEAPPPWTAEDHHAALTIQRVLRGHWCRRAIHAFFGPRNQQKAVEIQRIYRGHLGRGVVARRRATRWFENARRIQTWVRGIQARDAVAILLVHDTVARVVTMQRVYRGYSGRVLARRLRHVRRSTHARTIQRVYRGHRGRATVAHMIFQNQTHARNLGRAAHRHAVSNRCHDCNYSHCTETSLLGCVFARALGIFDVRGAKQLCLDGMHLFPTHAMFPLLLSVLMQVACESLDVAMLYLHQAKLRGWTSIDVKRCETLYFFAALEWSPGNAVVAIVFAVFLQSIGLLKRAETFYRQALNVHPLNYPLDSYLARKALSEHIVLNFKRYLCLYKLPVGLRVNITARNLLLPDTTPAEKLRRRFVLPPAAHRLSVDVTVTRNNHYAVIAPDDPTWATRVNAIYLADDEIAHLLKVQDKSKKRGAAVDDDEPSEDQDQPRDRGRRRAMANVHRRRHAGATPKELAMLSDAKTTVRLSTEQAEIFLNQVVLLPSAVKSSTGAATYVMVFPRLLRWRQHTAWALHHYEALVNIQRIYRGHVVRYRKSRQLLVDRLKDDQMRALQIRLSRRKFLRMERAHAATQIQALRRGYLTRRRLKTMAAAATKIQSIVRRELAKQLVEEIRQGNLMQFPVIRVFHRGIELQGKLVLLSIDQRGLSFRFTGVDYASCKVLTGCCPRDRTLQMVRYWHFLYAHECVGHTLFHLGQFGTAVAVDVETYAPEIRVFCQLGTTCQVSLTLGQAGVAIRTAQTNAQRRSPSKATPASLSTPASSQISRSGSQPLNLFPLPVDVNSASQLVAAMLPHLALVPTMDIPTRQMQQTAAAMNIAVVAPRTSPLFVASLVPRRYKPSLKPQLPPVLVRQLPKPYQHKLRLDSSIQTRHRFQYPDRVDSLLPPLPPPIPPGKPRFRRQCPRHCTTYTRCKCFLPVVDTPAHVASLEAALALGRPSDDKTRQTILANEIPNRSGRMWLRPKMATAAL